MGTKVKAICKCGVNKDILIGGGMRSFKYKNEAFQNAKRTILKHL